MKTIEELIEACNDPREGYAAGLYAGYEFRKHQGAGAREAMQDAHDMLDACLSLGVEESSREDIKEILQKLGRFLK